MQVAENIRPKLTSLRVLSFHGDSQTDADGMRWFLDLRQDIQLALAVPTVSGTGLQVAVRVELKAEAKSELSSAAVATFSGLYEAKFIYPPEVTEEMVSPLMEQEPYQYLMVAQAYPLAMTHFRRELQSMGFDARSLPLGLST